MKKVLPASFNNPITLTGASIATVTFATIVFLTLVELLQSNSPAYIGIVTYVILPVFLVAGLLLIPFGIWREKRRFRKGMPASKLSFTLDLNQPKQRTAVTFFATTTVILLLFTAYGSYRTFEWTESVEFCGTTCHKVMEPEHTAYLNSPHARVKCVDCHVGSGAGWYVRSKLSGAYQVYAVMAGVYPQPIPTPIKNLRPAQETCEQCHWPSHFSGEKKFVNRYFKSDEQNTPWTVALLMKIGGGTVDRVPTSGIHWHMNIANEITYVTVDSQRQVIPWVKIRNRATGAEEEFLSTESSMPVEQLQQLQKNTMDCIDCHNRPSHIYRPPVRIVDQSMALGRISTELPAVRTAAIQSLTTVYTTKAAAMDSIAIQMKEYFEKNYPEAARGKGKLIEAAIEELRLQYGNNFFPYMRTDWRSSPNNIGHMTDIGCFRCHDGKHVSPDGKIITKDCNSCHTILYQGNEPSPSTLSVGGLAFQHPEDIGDAWNEMNCSDCHGTKNSQ